MFTGKLMMLNRNKKRAQASVANVNNEFLLNSIEQSLGGTVTDKIAVTDV